MSKLCLKLISIFFVFNCLLSTGSFAQTIPPQLIPVLTDPYDFIDPVIAQTDFDALITLRSANDIEVLRHRLVRHIFNQTNLPSKRLVKRESKPAIVYLGDGATGIAEVFEHEMRFGFRHTVVRFTPEKPRGPIFIYAQGHDGSISKGAQTLRALLAAGFTVYAMPMPCLGESICPDEVKHPRIGPIRMVLPGGWDHAPLRLLKQPGFNPMSLFIEPMVVTVNTIKAESPSAQIAVTGLSGGGWMATLHPAIDPRVRWSFPVSGTHPHPLWFRPPAKSIIGDYEQSDPELYNIANYPELYILASVGERRRSIQMLNQYDSCCFAGLNARAYVPAVQRAVKRLSPRKGNFDLLIDSTVRGHAIPTAAIDLMIKTFSE
jgi:hypothetical protein